MDNNNINNESINNENIDNESINNESKDIAVDEGESKLSEVAEEKEITEEATGSENAPAEATPKEKTAENEFFGFTDEAPSEEKNAEQPAPAYMHTPYFNGMVSENNQPTQSNDNSFAQWTYGNQNNYDDRIRKNQSKGSLRTFVIVMVSVFSTAIVMLILSLVLGSALYRDDKVIREEIIIGDRTVYVHEDGSVGGKLTIPEVYEKMKPSTVEISVTTANGGGTGTGIIMTEDGYVITNAHVVEGAKKITVTFFDKKTYDADLIGLDTLADVALVKIKDTSVKFVPAEFGSSSDLLVGEAVVAIGCPAGYFLTATNGIVSALPTKIEIYEEGGYTEKEMYLLQTSAPLNPGNSGGPLCNLDGKVIGINTLKMVQSADGTPYEGLGFSIPINEALDIINDIKAGKQTAGGEISKKTMKLGVTGSICVKGESDGAGGKYGESGVYVADVAKGSNAEGNLEIGDIIVAFNGNKISEFDPFSNHIREMKDGEKLTLSVYRNGSIIEVVIEMSILK